MSKLKSCFILVASLMFIVPLSAEDAIPCDEYYMTVSNRKDSVLLYSLVRNQTLEEPHVDRVWITGKDTSVIILVAFVQPRDSLDISSLTRGVYICFVQVGDCIYNRIFTIRGRNQNGTTDNLLPHTKIVLSITPNPVRDFLSITSTEDLTHIYIYNLNGQCVLQTSQTDIDVSSLPQGMYILRAITSTGDLKQAKFIKE